MGAPFFVLKSLEKILPLLYNVYTMKRTKKKMKLWKKLLIICLSVILGVSALLGGAVMYFRLSVDDYYSASEKAFRIPDINNGIVPQGLEYDATNGYFLMSGYMKNGSASRLYIVQKSNGKKIKHVTFLTDEGKTYKGHFSGVARYNDFLYVTNGTSILVYSYDSVLKAENGSAITCLGKISTKKSDSDYVTNSFLTVYNNTLIAGEFYNGKQYKTLNSHKLTTKAGDRNCAIALEYELNPSYHLGIDTVPKKAYSLPNEVQGLCISNNRIYLSTSYGVKFSEILEYNQSKLNQEKYATFLGESIPVYSLDSSSLVEDYEIPPMSEEIVMVNKELYVMCESASDKYIFGKFIGATWCYKTNLKEMDD